LREFGIKGHFTTRVARLAAFNQFLLNAYARQEHVVLIVDEAQNLGPEALEELRLLSNLQAEKEPLLQVILVGQPALQERLRHPSLMQLAQRISVQYHLTPLDRKETREYIVYRLARAGGSGIFTDSALEKLYDYHQRGAPPPQHLVRSGPGGRLCRRPAGNRRGIPGHGHGRPGGGSGNLGACRRTGARAPGRPPAISAELQPRPRTTAWVWRWPNCPPA
jgi:hypothetical protein